MLGGGPDGADIEVTLLRERASPFARGRGVRHVADDVII